MKIKEYNANVKSFALYFLMLSFIDVLLFVLTKNATFDIEKNYLYIIIVNILIAFIMQFLIVRFDTIGIMISNILIAILLFLTLIEIVIFKTFDTFIEPFSLLKNTANVTTTFTDDLYKIITANFLLIIILITIYIIFISLSKKCLMRKRSRKPFIRKEETYKRINYIVLLFSMLLLFFTMAFVNSTNNFSLNVERNGIKSALFLDVFFNNNVTLIKSDKESENESNKELVNSQTEYNVLDIDFENLDISDVDKSFKDINSYVSSRKASNKNNYTGLFKGKNLILICAEAFSYNVIDEKLTPVLYRLTNNGFKFTDYYVQSFGGSTITGEYAFLNGIIPEYGVESLKEVINKNMCFTLPRALKREGYNTFAFHNGSARFYDRNKSHGKNLGFDEFVAIGKDMNGIIGGWVDDIKLFTNTIDYYHDKSPFCMYYMTISGHAFYNDNSSEKVIKYINRVKDVYGDKYPDQINNYLCYQLFLEDALKALIEKLEEYNLIDDTVICMNSDHYPYGLYNNSFTEDFDYLPILYEKSDMDKFDRDKNMPIIWAKCLEDENIILNKIISEPASSLDLVPTLLNLFGLKFDSRLLVGRDVFSDLEAIVPYNNGGYITSKGRKYSELSPKFNIYEGLEIDNDYEEHMDDIVRNFNVFSKFIVDNDYYDYIFSNKNAPYELKNDMKYEKIDD